MTKNTLTAINTILSAYDFEGKDAILAEIGKELNKGAEKSAKASADYEAAWVAVKETFAQTTAPLTVAEVYEAAEDALPEGFTKGKVQYGLTHQWADRVVKIEGKPNTYRLA